MAGDQELIGTDRSVALEGFEQVEAGPGTVLLRLAAHRPAGSPVQGRPTLVIDAGAEQHRVSPLPAPPDPEGVLRAAYSVPAALLGAGAGFALELPDGTPLELPAPTPRRQGSAADREELVRERALREEAEQRAARAAGLEAALAAADAQIAALEAGREVAQAEHELLVIARARIIELEAAVIDANHTLAAADEAASAEREEWRRRITALEHAEQSATSLSDELEQAKQALERAQAQKADAEQALEQATKQSELYERDNEQLRERVAEIEAQAHGRSATEIRGSERGGSLLQARASHPGPPQSGTASARLLRRRIESAWLPSESVLGICLVIFGLTFAVLILTGVLKLGVAP